MCADRKWSRYMIAAKLLCYSHYATDKVKEISIVKYITITNHKYTGL